MRRLPLTRRSNLLRDTVACAVAKVSPRTRNRSKEDRHRSNGHAARTVRRACLTRRREGARGDTRSILSRSRLYARATHSYDQRPLSLSLSLFLPIVMIITGRIVTAVAS